MTDPEDDPLLTSDAAERMARLTTALAATLPDGMTFVMFLIAGNEDEYHSSIVSNSPPSAFAPILRGWLERFDSGKIYDA